jgi:hypothetical protein
MEPGENARLEGRWWVWSPDLAPLRELVLASSGATGAGWTLCDIGGCRKLGYAPQEPIVLRPCHRP